MAMNKPVKPAPAFKQALAPVPANTANPSEARKLLDDIDTESQHLDAVLARYNAAAKTFRQEIRARHFRAAWLAYKDQMLLQRDLDTVTARLRILQMHARR